MSKAYVGNAADPEQVSQAGEKVRSREELEREDVVFILADVRGRRFFWRYLEKCGVFKSSVMSSPEHTYFREGERNVGLSLLADLNNARPTAYIEMMEEARKREEKAV